MTAAPQRLVVALGGNALSDRHSRRSSVASQAAAARQAFTALADVIASTPHVLICHGNGPQIGSLLLRSELSAELHGLPRLPLDTLVADTAGGLGYTLAKELRNAVGAAVAERGVATLVSAVLVDPWSGPPTKPIGEAYDRARRPELEARGWDLVDTPEGRVRRVVHSPAPREVLEIDAIRRLYEAGVVVIAGGGGGVPVRRDGDGCLHGFEGVVDKDLVAALLARELEADALAILTDVANVLVGYGTPGEHALGEISAIELRALQDRGEFPAGSMGPKVEAALQFTERTGGCAVIGSLDAADAALAGKSGTRVVDAQLDFQHGLR